MVHASTVHLEILAAVQEWTTPEQVFERFIDRYAREHVGAALSQLVAADIIVVAGSEEAARDDRYAKIWGASPADAAFHFSLHGLQYANVAQIREHLVERVAAEPSPDLVHRNERHDVELGRPACTDELLATMRRRRSYRGFATAPLSREALAECLFAGCGVVGFTPGSVEGEGELPLTMTPSGGARNPHDAYVFANNVEGVPPGAYRYDGVDGSLMRVGETLRGDHVLGEQAWFADAGAVVVFVAEMARMIWKYPQAGVYRVICIEAGHIAQNVLLAATKHSLAATPTCALSDRAIAEVLGLDRVTHALVHAVALGARGDARSAADPTTIRWID